MASPSTRSSRRIVDKPVTIPKQVPIQLQGRTIIPPTTSSKHHRPLPLSPPNPTNTSLRSATANAHNTRRITPQALSNIHTPTLSHTLTHALPNTSSRRKRLRDDEVEDIASKKPKIVIQSPEPTAATGQQKLKLRENVRVLGRKRGLGGLVNGVDATTEGEESITVLTSRANGSNTSVDVTATSTQLERAKPTTRTQQSSAAVARLRENHALLQSKAVPNKPVAVGAPTKHAEKVVAGIKHELDRLMPKAEDTKADEKRKLRSQEGTRFKSELALYFPDYDIVIGNESEETHFLNIDTPIIITDSNPSSDSSIQADSPAKSSPAKRVSIKFKVPPKIPARDFPDTLFHNLHQAQKVDLSGLGQKLNGHIREDPLTDEYYKGHDKSERLERNIRNGEKNKAMHERDQVARLLEALQGHDWLKVMGVSGITESKKKDYEPAREHFLRGCQGILEKFKQWKEEEKRRKMERDQQIAEAEELEDEDEEDEEDVEVEEEGDGNESDGDPPDYSDVDHAAARQLHEEAIARSAGHSSRDKRHKVVVIEPSIQKLEREFKSFYSKPHLREAALGKHRRSGRTTSAWGQPIPEVAEEDFDLPVEFRDKDILEANARKRRRERRISKE